MTKATPAGPTGPRKAPELEHLAGNTWRAVHTPWRHRILLDDGRTIDVLSHFTDGQIAGAVLELTGAARIAGHVTIADTDDRLPLEDPTP